MLTPTTRIRLKTSPARWPNLPIVWLAGPRGRARHRVGYPAANSRTATHLRDCPRSWTGPCPMSVTALALAAPPPGGHERPEPPPRPPSTSSAPRFVGEPWATTTPTATPPLYGTLWAWPSPGESGAALVAPRADFGSIEGDRRIDAVHRGPHGPRRGGHAPRTSAGHGGLSAQLRRPSHRARWWLAFSLPPTSW